MGIRELHVFITAGEPSGDILGARVMESLRRRAGGNIRFSGVGGPLMEAQGLRSLFPMRDLSVMGVAEVLPRLPLILRRIRQTAKAVSDMRPDVVVTVDSPDFSFRVARKIRAFVKTPPRMIHYVAPTVWAWRPERAKKVAGLYDGILCLFPMEPAYFEKEGMVAAFTGHPVVGTAAGHGDRAGFRADARISGDAPVLGLFFGSRVGELNRMGPLLRDAAIRIAESRRDLFIVAPTLPHLEPLVHNLLLGVPCRKKIVTDPAQKWDAFAAMDAALATSGTVGLELAAAGVPHVIGYRLSALSWKIVRHKLKVRFAHLVNILLDRPAVPEFIQDDCRPAAMADEILRIMGDAAARDAQKDAFARVRTMLSGAGGENPADQAAGFILGLAEEKERAAAA